MMVQDMLLHTDFVSVAGYWLMLDWQEMLQGHEICQTGQGAVVALYILC